MSFKHIKKVNLFSSPPEQRKLRNKCKETSRKVKNAEKRIEKIKEKQERIKSFYLDCLRQKTQNEDLAWFWNERGDYHTPIKERNTKNSSLALKTSAPQELSNVDYRGQSMTQYVKELEEENKRLRSEISESEKINSGFFTLIWLKIKNVLSSKHMKIYADH